MNIMVIYILPMKHCLSIAKLRNSRLALRMSMMSGRQTCHSLDRLVSHSNRTLSILIFHKVQSLVNFLIS